MSVRYGQIQRSVDGPVYSNPLHLPAPIPCCSNRRRNHHHCHGYRLRIFSFCMEVQWRFSGKVGTIGGDLGAGQGLSVCRHICCGWLLMSVKHVLYNYYCVITRIAARDVTFRSQKHWYFQNQGALIKAQLEREHLVDHIIVACPRLYSKAGYQNPYQSCSNTALILSS